MVLMAASTTHIDWRLVLSSALALLLAAVAPVRADGIGNENAPAQETCGLCHGFDGVSPMSKFPRLAGQKADYILKQLEDFREGRRSNDGGQMSAIVTEFPAEKLAEAARYFAGLAPPPPVIDRPDGAGGALARKLFHEGDEARGIPACAGCHLPNVSRAETAHAPHIAAQHPDYLLKQLREFAAGARNNDGTGAMTSIAKALSAQEIVALANFLAAMPREPSHAH
jgi:cytochrome c553